MGPRTEPLRNTPKHHANPKLIDAITRLMIISGKPGGAASAKIDMKGAPFTLTRRARPDASAGRPLRRAGC